MDKCTAIEAFKEIVRDHALEKDMCKKSQVCPKGNVIGRILDDISYFVEELLLPVEKDALTLFLVNTDDKSIARNKFSWSLPVFRTSTKNIYFALAGDLSFTDLNDLELKVILAHEYFHFLESAKIFGSSSQIMEGGQRLTNEIISESRADYFAGFFLKNSHTEDDEYSQILEKGASFVSSMSIPISDLQLEVKKGVYYLVDGDTHGTPEHRSSQFQNGFLSGNLPFLSNANNFIPDTIEAIDTKDKKYYP